MTDTPRFFRKPPEVPALTPEEFGFAFSLWNSAAALKGPFTNPEMYGLTIDFGGGDVQDVRLTDEPMNRGAVAVKEHFGEDRTKFQVILFRMMALAIVMRDSRLKDWEKPSEDDPECTLIHPAIIHVAATMPLDRKGNFNARKFYQKVAATARQLDAAEGTKPE